MTKKPSEKNKAWEKERRDRLNKTFDELAKLLPKYDPSVVWSKIEIIQKAINFIADLQKKQGDYLKSKDPELFKAYEEFVDCLKFYQERSAQLTELLKKAKVALPPVVLPQLLLDKPELLPKEENADAAGPPKPKRKRNRPKKTAPDVSAKNTEDNATGKGEDSSQKAAPTDDVASPLRSPLVAPPEVAAKPTAIITALTRETPCEVSVAVEPPPPPPEPAKPLLLLRKPNSLRRLKLIPKPVFRKCYPHPDRMLRWASHLKLPPKRRQIPKKKRKVEPTARLKVEPIREQSVSPTAAFLLSFPVVTSSMLGGKNVENTESAVSLENLNNFFTTDEYSKFCTQNTVIEEKTAIPVKSGDKPLSRGKPMTAFTVSAITRPSSPKKPNAQCEQVASKRVNDDPWIVENKFIRSTPVPSFESCYNSSRPSSMMSSANQQIAPAQQTPTNTSSVARFSTPAAEQITSVKLEPVNCALRPTKSSSTGQFFPRYNHSTPSSNTMSTTNIMGSTSKAPNAAMNSFATQKTPVRAATCTSKPATSGCATIPTQGLVDVLITKHVSSSANCKKSSKCVPSTATATAMTKPETKPSANSFYSPTKSFFHDFPTQSPAADPLISSTTAAKPHSFLGFPSIKTEFPWLVPNTNSFTTPSTPTTMTTTATACSLNTSFTPFDLASIVCESLTSTSFTFSLTTAKSSEPVVVEAGNKQHSASKCNQMNLFLPYEETQYMKPTDNQVYPSAKAKEISDQIFYDCEQSKPQQKSHVNWMTSPTTDYTPAPAAVPLPPIDFGSQFPASASFDYNFGCRKDSYDDDNQFINWSPTKPLSADFSTAYSFENFGSNEAPPNKTVKQIFSVSQLVDQHSTPIKKAKPATQKSTPVKQTFSNIYSAESLIAKKDNHHMTNVNSYCNTDATNTQSDYHNTSNYFYNYANTQNCLDNDYLSASGYSSSTSTVKTTSMLPSTANVIPAFDAAAGSSSGNYFAHTISSNTNDPYDPTYFPSSNYNHAANWKGPPVNSYNQGQLYGTAEPSCQQNANVSGNLTNFNLSSICPEIDGKDGTNGW